MKIKNFAALAVVVLALVASFAFKPQARLAFTYGISSENASGWVLQQNATSLTPICGDPRTADCTVTSNTSYANGNTIPYADGVPVTESREYIPQ